MNLEAKKNISAEIIADSINEKNIRLTTFILEFPRWILAELNTHRAFSKNTASSRAIPFATMAKRIQNNIAMPVFWGANCSGMQSPDCLKEDDAKLAEAVWREAAESAIQYAGRLNKIGLHKQYTNRLIENFSYVRVILSATDFDNWFILRAHNDAQPEIRELAYKMLDAYNASTPKSLLLDEWHIPFADKMDIERVVYCAYKNNLSVFETQKRICVARCARVSYFNFEGKDDYQSDIDLCNRLFQSNPKHLSPTEHVARSMGSTEYFGNFRGWRQFRKDIEGTMVKDPRIVEKVFSGFSFADSGK